VELLQGISLNQKYMKVHVIRTKFIFFLIIHESKKINLLNNQKYGDMCTTSKCDCHDYINMIAIESNPLFITYL
jgi:hypothetical protein